MTTDVTATIRRVLAAAARSVVATLMAEVERLRAENAELRDLNAVNESGCNRALEQMDTATGVAAALTAEVERLRARVAELEGLAAKWDNDLLTYTDPDPMCLAAATCLRLCIRELRAALKGTK